MQIFQIQLQTYLSVVVVLVYLITDVEHISLDYPFVMLSHAEAYAIIRIRGYFLGNDGEFQMIGAYYPRFPCSCRTLRSYQSPRTKDRYIVSWSERSKLLQYSEQSRIYILQIYFQIHIYLRKTLSLRYAFAYFMLEHIGELLQKLRSQTQTGCEFMSSEVSEAV